MDMAFSGEFFMGGVALEAEQAAKKIAVSRNRFRMDEVYQLKSSRGMFYVTAALMRVL
jgi:hypothetical protein